MPSRLILICSGVTEATRKARFPAGEPLEPKSQAAAMAMAGRLPKAVEAWCSPAPAALQTAEALGLTAQPRDALRDQDPGTWAGKTLAEVEALDPTALIAWVTDPTAAAPGGESLQDVAHRIAPLLPERQGKGGTVLAVTHPAVIRVMAALVLDAPLQSALKIDVEPLGLTELTSDGRRWHLRRLGVPGIAGLP